MPPAGPLRGGGRRQGTRRRGTGWRTPRRGCACPRRSPCRRSDLTHCPPFSPHPGFRSSARRLREARGAGRLVEVSRSGAARRREPAAPQASMWLLRVKRRPSTDRSTRTIRMAILDRDERLRYGRPDRPRSWNRRRTDARSWNARNRVLDRRTDRRPTRPLGSYPTLPRCSANRVESGSPYRTVSRSRHSVLP